MPAWQSLLRQAFPAAVQPPPSTISGVDDEFSREQLTGLAYILRGRLFGLLLLSFWAATLPFERSGAYLLAIAAFALLGVIPYVLTRRGYGGPAVVAVFVFLDACLLTYILIVPPDFYVEGWTPQINMRLPNFLFMGIFLISMALSYSPGLVVWAGVASVLAWTGGFLWIASLPDTVLSSSRRTLDTGMSPDAVIRLFLDRHTVSVTAFSIQIVFLVLTTLILTLTVWRSRHLVRSHVAAERARTALSRYFSPNIVKSLSKSSVGLDRPVVQPAAVLFADMVGFTALTENMGPAELIGLLREFHGRLAQVTFAHGGTVDKYIGDEIMVHFGTPDPREDDPVRALTCAAAMIEELRAWNVERSVKGDGTIAVGIGIHYGNVVVGSIGHAQRLEYTVLGDTVNVASRLERLTRELRCTLVVSEALVEAARRKGSDPEAIVIGLRPDEEHQVRGRDQAISIWCLGHAG